MSIVYDIWYLFVDAYTPPPTSPVDATSKMKSESNSKAMNAILCGLLEVEFVKVMQCESTKMIWDKLNTIYEGYTKMKINNL